MPSEIPSSERVVLSACLAGVACAHDAQGKARDWAVRLVADGRAVLVCPEVAGGLPIPRPAAEIQGGDGGDVIDGRARVVTQDGVDVTGHFLRGAHVVCDAARAAGVTTAILKARSPSCGCGRTYDGTFTGTLRSGDGVTAALFRREGVRVVADDEW